MYIINLTATGWFYDRHECVVTLTIHVCFHYYFYKDILPLGKAGEKKQISMGRSVNQTLV